MTQQPPSSLPTLPGLRLREARALIAAELGREQLAALHRPNLLLDIVSVAGSLGLFLALAVYLGAGSGGDLLWWLALLAQGNLVLVLAYIHHDAFVHRKLFSRPVRWLLASLVSWPSQLRASAYERQHLKHHRALGTPEDTEAYKHEIDTPLRRLLYATAAIVVYRAVVLRGRTASEAVGVARPDPGSEVGRRAILERVTWLVLVLLALLAALSDWRVVVYGYLLPFTVVTPALNTVRMILEHFDLDASNPLWVGTFYRSGPLTRLMFWWGGGDCHMVHHFYPTIPFYRIGRAATAIRPILARHGVVEHRSLLPLLRQWFRDGRGHWTRPPEAIKPGV